MSKFHLCATLWAVKEPAGKEWESVPLFRILVQAPRWTERRSAPTEVRETGEMVEPGSAAMKTRQQFGLRQGLRHIVSRV